MKNNKFEYCMNALHYCIYKGEVRLYENALNNTSKYLRFFSKLFGFEKWYHRVAEKNINDTEGRKIFFDKKKSFSVGEANSTFGFLYSGYPGLFSFILGGLWYRFFEYKYPLLNAILFGLPIGIGYIPAYRAVFTKDKYLKYYKKFEKKDASWHKKWKWITIAFCIGSWIMLAIGVAAMWGVLLF
ncbi:hypothetical protein [Segatella baroniae]|uniref:hypothetical protein n=1 Tax=Segatella baroniae TaxID=305719 RepID=UPI000420A293|nr:hypothetical protein [Segatella baroniae]